MVEVDTRRIDRLRTEVYHLPLQQAESDGTHCWQGLDLVLVEIGCGDTAGYGYTYNHAAAGELIERTLREIVIDASPYDQRRIWGLMLDRLRNLGRPGVVSAAVAAVDCALWDLAARLQGLPLHRLLGACRDAIPIYGSGGFTSLDDDALAAQLSAWCEQGITRVKMKVGPDRAADRRRVALARRTVGRDVELMVDANGAYDRKQALAQAEAFADQGVNWFEEPVDAEDFGGLRLLRDRAPARIEISAGEYGYHLAWFRRLLDAEAIDVLQADVTRCAGITGFIAVSALCQAHHLPLSSHTAPTLHRHLACACPPLRHCEWFADHADIERRFFAGAPEPDGGWMRPDPEAPGLGIEPRRADLDTYLVRH